MKAKPLNIQRATLFILRVTRFNISYMDLKNNNLPFLYNPNDIPLGKVAIKHILDSDLVFRVHTTK